MKELNKKEQISMFDGFGAYILARDYLESGYQFCEEAEMKIFNLPPEITEELILLQLQKGIPLHDIIQKKIFDLPQQSTEKIVLAELEQGFPLCEDTLLDIASLPQGTLILESYYLSSGNTFSAQAQCLLISISALASTAQRFIYMNKKTPNRLCKELSLYAEEHGWLTSLKRKVS